MAEYSIKDLENFTNIKAHTLRIWEQRYNLLEPKRTATNIRYYTDQDLKKILNVNLLYNNGYKISRIAQMSDAEITKIASDLLKIDQKSGDQQVDDFIRYILELDEQNIMRSLQDINRDKGPELLYTEVLIPLLRKIGELWQVDTITVSHEHFFSNLLRDFLVQEIAKIPTAIAPRGRIVLFLHERELHELSLMFYHLVLKKRNYECYYLGQSVPMKDLRTFVEQMKPDFLVTSLLAEMDRAYIAQWINDLISFFPAGRIYIGGAMTQRYMDLFPESIKHIQSIDDIKIN